MYKYRQVLSTLWATGKQWISDYSRKLLCHTETLQQCMLYVYVRGIIWTSAAALYAVRLWEVNGIGVTDMIVGFKYCNNFPRRRYEQAIVFYIPGNNILRTKYSGLVQSRSSLVMAKYSWDVRNHDE